MDFGIASTMPVNHVVENLLSVPLICVAISLKEWRLEALKLPRGLQRTVALYMGYPTREQNDPAVIAMQEILREICIQT